MLSPTQQLNEILCPAFPDWKISVFVGAAALYCAAVLLATDFIEESAAAALSQYCAANQYIALFSN